MEYLELSQHEYIKEMKQYNHDKSPRVPMSSTTNLRTELPNDMNKYQNCMKKY